MRLYDEFGDAQADQTPDVTIGGTYRADGRPVYFLVDRSLSDEDAHDLAFEARYGRGIGGYERWLLDVVKSRAIETTAVEA